MENEIWVPIRGYEDIYMLSNLGRVKSISRYFMRHGYKVYLKETILKTYSNRGYPSVKLCKNAVTKQAAIHRILAIHFLPNPENKPDINHINGIKGDFRLENLEWCTHKENINHALRTKLIVRKSSQYDCIRREIIDISTGELFPTLDDAVAKTKIKRSTLRCYLTGHRTNKTSLRYTG